MADLSGTAVAGPHVADVIAIAAGQEHTCVLQSAGTVQCWGLGRELGDGTADASDDPVMASGLTDATAIATASIGQQLASQSHTCAVRQNGQVVCWGSNSSGQLGVPLVTTEALAPVTVGGVSNAVAVSLGSLHSCALLADHTVTCWGHGALGDSEVPVPVSNLQDVGAIAAGGDHNCALLAGGTVACWVQDAGAAPALVPGISGATSIAAGGAINGQRFDCATLPDGGVKCWGRNGRGQLGDGTTNDSIGLAVTAQVGAAVQLALGAGHACALLEIGKVACWGDNSFAELGNDTWPASAVPGPVVCRPELSASTSCSSAAECASGFCVDGVCCESECGGGAANDCQVCSAALGASRDGTCTFISGGTVCAQVDSCHPNPGLCTGIDGTCSSLNAIPNCVVEFPNGHACTGDGECASHSCVDSVCCESSCGRNDARRCATCAATPGTCTALAANTPCYTRAALCDSIEPTQTCGGALSCPPPTHWDPNACSSPSSNVVSLLGGIDMTPPLTSGGLEVRFATSWTGTIAAKRVKVGCPDKPGFDLLPEDTAGDGYFWELVAEPPITCAPGQTNCVQMQVCVQYDEQWILDAGWGDVSAVEANLQLLHGFAPAGGGGGCDPASNGWMPSTTTTVDTVNNVVCTTASSLSPFGLFIPKPGSFPTIQVPTSVAAAATSTAGARVTYVATATDAQDGALTPNCVPASGTTFSPGTTTVRCTVVDHDGLPAAASFPVRVSYQAPTDGTFFGQPINPDGSSIFKRGSTIPVKFRLTGASAGITTLVARLYTAKITNGVTGTVVEAESNVPCDGGNTFRYDASARQYVYNLATKSLITGTWLLRVDLGDGVDHSVRVSLK